MKNAIFFSAKGKNRPKESILKNRTVVEVMTKFVANVPPPEFVRCGESAFDTIRAASVWRTVCARSVAALVIERGRGGGGGGPLLTQGEEGREGMNGSRGGRHDCPSLLPFASLPSPLIMWH